MRYGDPVLVTLSPHCCLCINLSGFLMMYLTAKSSGHQRAISRLGHSSDFFSIIIYPIFVEKTDKANSSFTGKLGPVEFSRCLSALNPSELKGDYNY